MLQSSTLKFLKDLEKNNNKPWFDAHRPVYEDAKKDFAVFIQEVIDKHGKKDPAIRNLVAKDCMFRINRDVRFSKNKAPYKNNFGASINKGGKQSVSSAGYYFHLQPGRSFAGGGIWMPAAEDLKKVRQEIDYNFADFKKILRSAKFKTVYGDLSQEAEFKLTRLPKGYEPGNPAAEYLKLKSFIAMIELKDAEVNSGDLVKKTLTAFEALRPVVEFINRALE
jgi:uncharacterized protein (TIGR02453 family)